ncbi:MAG: MBOAT family O-acyltransferase [Bacteroidota bacterium]
MVVFLAYWYPLKNRINAQNVLILVSSYLFYGWWDYRFLSLIIISSVLDYNLGIAIHNTRDEKWRKGLLYISLLGNLGILGYFKYYNFFVESFVNSFESIGINLNSTTLNVVLPVGISFYTFQTLSYTIDVYRDKLKPTKNWITFFAYVCFFPQLVAGPIERAKNLIPQFEKNRVFELEKAKDGMRQILIGLIKKVVIADNCALAVNAIFSDPQSYNSPTLVLGTILFAFQIYGDFSGYSDIAIGSARLLGFDLMKNFNFPYFAKDIADFWRRWHISLSTWFRDYLYIPLGGSRVESKGLLFRNVMVIFIVSGFWHGANWTFIFWGFLHALFFLPLIFLGLNRKNIATSEKTRLLPSFKELIQMGITFSLVCFAWIFFRVDSISDGFYYVKEMVMWEGVRPLYLSTLLYVIFFLVIEWVQKDKEHSLDIRHLPRPVRWATYYTAIFILFYFMPDSSPDFIYFQF